MSVGFALVQAALLVPIALLIREVFNESIPEGNTTQLVWIGAGILGLYVGSSGLGLINRWIALRATKESVARLRNAIASKVLGLPMSYFDRTDTGALHARIVEDSERVDVMSNALVGILIPTTIVGATLGATLVVLDPLLTLLLALVIPPLVLAGRLLGRRLRTRTRAWQEAFDRFSSTTLRGLRASMLTRLHGAGELELERQRAEHEAVRHTGLRMAWMASAYTSAQTTMAAASGVVVLVVGGAAVANGSASLGDLISYYAMLGLLRGQLTTALFAIPLVIAGSESLRRLQEILDEPAAEPYQGEKRLDFQGSMEMQDVTFGYDEEPVLRGVNFRVRAGEIVALIGRNGAGKSTILSLLCGLYRPDSGTVSADGVELDELDVNHLRRQIGVVVQDPLIFPASARENISYGHPHVTDAELSRAVERADAAGFTSALPRGLDTHVGDDGVLLSGGERQRLALARALIGEPALLMLDEPTTHLDREGIESLLGPLREESGRPAIVLISHDPAVAAIADRICEIRAGRIEEIKETASLPTLS